MTSIPRVAYSQTTLAYACVSVSIPIPMGISTSLFTTHPVAVAVHNSPSIHAIMLARNAAAFRHSALDIDF